MTAKRRVSRSKTKALCRSSRAAAMPPRKLTAPSVSIASAIRSKTFLSRQRLAAHCDKIRQALPQFPRRHSDDWYALLDQAMSPDPSLLSRNDFVVVGVSV